MDDISDEDAERFMELIVIDPDWPRWKDYCYYKAWQFNIRRLFRMKGLEDLLENGAEANMAWCGWSVLAEANGGGGDGEPGQQL